MSNSYFSTDWHNICFRFQSEPLIEIISCIKILPYKIMDSYMWREIRVNERRKLILNYLSYFGGAYFIIEYYQMFPL